MRSAKRRPASSQLISVDICSTSPSDAAGSGRRASLDPPITKPFPDQHHSRSLLDPPINCQSYRLTRSCHESEEMPRSQTTRTVKAATVTPCAPQIMPGSRVDDRERSERGSNGPQLVRSTG